MTVSWVFALLLGSCSDRIEWVGHGAEEVARALASRPESSRRCLAARVHVHRAEGMYRVYLRRGSKTATRSFEAASTAAVWVASWLRPDLTELLLPAMSSSVSAAVAVAPSAPDRVRRRSRGPVRRDRAKRSLAPSMGPTRSSETEPAAAPPPRSEAPEGAPSETLEAEVEPAPLIPPAALATGAAKTSSAEDEVRREPPSPRTEEVGEPQVVGRIAPGRAIEIRLEPESAPPSRFSRPGAWVIGAQGEAGAGVDGMAWVGGAAMLRWNVWARPSWVLRGSRGLATRPRPGRSTIERTRLEGLLRIGHGIWLAPGLEWMGDLGVGLSFVETRRVQRTGFVVLDGWADGALQPVAELSTGLGLELAPSWRIRAGADVSLYPSARDEISPIYLEDVSQLNLPGDAWAVVRGFVGLELVQ